MNKNLYRIVFNKARGILMVVAENVSTQGKGDADPAASFIVKQETDSPCMQMRSISFAAKLAVGIMTVVTPLAHAQIIADPNAPGNQRPTILQTANGLPQVNIQTPSAAGVSRNTYSQFDVQSQGTILNNSRTSVQTQTGGWVQGNPWLVGGAARVILNEVNSSNPSQIRGYVEVAGQKAEVVIANPAGIQVNGGGFINADRVTLTTGTAVMNQANGGSLDSYRIPQGTISIDGLGLDTRTASYTDILARSVQVNAGIWANRLKVVTGANQVSTTSADYPGDVSQGVTPIAGTGAVPQFSLDVAAIGGMYAGHIYLVGSESGLGVRNKGAINATGGNLVLLSNGLLTNEGAIQAISSNGSDSNISVTANGTTNAGSIYASGNAALTSQGTVTNTGLIGAQGNATVQANGTGAQVNSSSGSVMASGLQVDGSLASSGNLTISAADAISLNGQTLAGGNLNVTGSRLDLSNGQIAGQNANLNALAGEVNASAAVMNFSGVLNVITPQTLRTDGAFIAAGQIGITADTVSNVGGQIAAVGSTDFNVGSLINTQGLIAANQGVTLNAISLDNTQGTIASVQNNLNLTTSGTITNDSGTLQAAQNVLLNAASLSNAVATGATQAGAILANNNVTLTTSGDVSNSGRIQAVNALTINASNIDNAATGIISSTTTNITAANTLTNRGLIDGQGTLINAASLTNVGTGRIYGDQLSIGAGTLTNDVETVNGVTTAATIAARTRLDIGASNITNRENAFVFSAGDIAIGGSLDGNGHATGQAIDLENSSATIQALGNLSIDAALLNNTDAHFAYSSQVTSVEPNLVNNVSGSQYEVFTRTIYSPIATSSNPAQILSGGDMVLNSQNATNYASHIVAGGTLSGQAASIANIDVQAQEITQDIGTLYTLVHIPQSGSCGFIKFHCVRAHDEWVSGAYSASSSQTVSVSNITAVQGSNAALPATVTGNSVITQVNATSISGGAVVRTAAPTPTLPSSSLFQISTNPASNYLIVTDPAFANYTQWVGSDYMLRALSIDPNVAQKRAGDGFYEQQLIQQQIIQLTGQNLLTGYANTQAEYQDLMNAGVIYAQQMNLVPGITLTAAQMAQLTTNMVWLVSQTVTLPDGTQQTVLVPQLYVVAQNGAANGAGAVIAGRNLSLNASGNLTNSGSLFASNTVNLAAQNINNLAGKVQGNRVAVSAVQDLNNIGGTIQAADILVATAGRDVNVQTTTSTTNNTVGSNHFGNTNVDRVASLSVTNANGTLIASAGQDVNLTAAAVTNGPVASTSTLATPDNGQTQIVAGRDINLGTVQTASSENVVWDSKNYLNRNQTTDVGTQVNGTGAIAMQAGNNVNATAANVQAAGDLSVLAANNININAGQASQSYDEAHEVKRRGLFSSTTLTTHNTSSETDAVSANFGGNTINLSAGKNLSVTGSNVVATNDVNLSATTGDIKIASTQESYSEQQASKQSTSGFTSSFSAGVASVGYGKSSSASQSSLDEINQHGANVASTSGNVRVQAGQQLTVIASDIGAGKDVTLIGSSVDLSAAQNTRVEHDAQQSSFSGFSVGVTLNPVAAFNSAYKDSGKNNKTTSTIGKMFKRDEGIADGSLAAATPVVVQAGSRSANSTQDYASSTAKVSTLNAGGALTILATNGSITSQGASMSAERDTLIVAQNDINLDVAHNFESQSQTNSAKGWSLDNRGSLPVGVFNNKGNGNGSTDTITGSSLSVGGKAALATTTGDITLTGSNVVASGDTSINAAKNLIIQSGQDTVYNDNHSDNKAIGKVVISDTERFAGYHNEKHNDTKDGITQVDANVASLQGNVTLSAGEQYTQTTSNILAGNDVSITAKAIDITTAANTGTSAQDNSDLKIGMFARISSPIIDLVNNIEAAQKSDGRLQAMQGMAAAANAYQAASVLTGGSGSIIKGEVGVGFASAKSKDASDYSQAQGSTITGGNNVSLTSTEGDIKATGSSITADKTLTLDSAKDILLDAGQSAAHSVGDNHSAGLEVGVGYSVGAQTGVYAYVAANVGKGDYNNDAIINSNTHLTGETVTLKSQGDTTLKGADVKADTINADIKGKLAIESVQDVVTQHNQQSNAGVRVQISFGTAWEASGSASQSKANGSSSTVNEQSGLFAGDGGYHVSADTVDLKGGAIASSNAANSELTANAITFQNIDNKMDYKASSMSVSGSFGGESKNADGSSGNNGIQAQKLGGASSGSNDNSGTQAPLIGTSGGPNLTPGIVLQDKGSVSSTTYATLTDGNISIGGNSMTSAKDLGAHTDLATANTAIAALPDLKNVMQNQQAMAAAANTVIATGAQIANDIANASASAAGKIQQAAQKVLDNSDSTAAQKETATTTLASATKSAADWGPTGDYTRALKVVTGVLVGGIAGQSVGQLAANASAPYAANAIGDYFTQPGNENQTAQILTHAVLGGILAAANGGNAISGASAGAAGELAAQVISHELYSQKDYPNLYDADGTFHPERMDAKQTNTVIALSTAIGALVSGVTGGSTLDASLGGTIAANAATNNYLKHVEIKQLLQAKTDCAAAGGKGSACDTVAALTKLDTARDTALANCTQTNNCSTLDKDARDAAAEIAQQVGNAKNVLPSGYMAYASDTLYQAVKTLPGFDLTKGAAVGTGVGAWGAVTGLVDAGKSIVSYMLLSQAATDGDAAAQEKINQSVMQLATLVSSQEAFEKALRSLSQDKLTTLATALSQGDGYTAGKILAEVPASVVANIALPGATAKAAGAAKTALAANAVVKAVEAAKGADAVAQAANVATKVDVVAGASSAGRVATYTGDVYAVDFVGPVEWKTFYRGDAMARSEFSSSMTQTQGVGATDNFLNSLSGGARSDILAEHGVSSATSPFIGTSINQTVAEYFARGPGQSQNGFVTTFRIEAREAEMLQSQGRIVPNFENPMSFFEVNPHIGLPESEFLFHNSINPKYIYIQTPVGLQ